MVLQPGAGTNPARRAINVAFDAATLYVLFICRGDGSHRAPPLLLRRVALGNAALLPGGGASSRASMLAILTTLGVEHSAAIVAVLAYRLVSFWIPALIGLPLAAALQRATRPLDAS